MGRKLRKWALAAGLWAVSSLAAQNPFTLKKEHDSLYWLNDWRLPYPVYQFQTGDVDGDGRADAMSAAVHLQAGHIDRSPLEGAGEGAPAVAGLEAGRHPRGLPLRGASRGRLDGQDPCPGIDHRLALRGDRLQMGELRHEVRPLSDQRSRQTNSNKNL